MNANQLTKIPLEKLSDTLQFLIAENEIPLSDALKQVIDDVDAVCKKLLRDESAPAQPVSEPYKLEIDLDDADHFSITHLQEIIYGKELIWPEAKLLARFMLDVKQRVSAAPAQESE
ncbi:hypothetical protein [Hafnia alvei]|uniref:hypothetical protein n=1 Tax=Hafnia alvei TaxID=569 RepID=UPI00396D02C0